MNEHLLKFNIIINNSNLNWIFAMKQHTFQDNLFYHCSLMTSKLCMNFDEPYLTVQQQNLEGVTFVVNQSHKLFLQSVDSVCMNQNVVANMYDQDCEWCKCGDSICINQFKNNSVLFDVTISTIVQDEKYELPQRICKENNIPVVQ